jgi:hypothetical protein
MGIAEDMQTEMTRMSVRTAEASVGRVIADSLGKGLAQKMGIPKGSEAGMVALMALALPALMEHPSVREAMGSTKVSPSLMSNLRLEGAIQMGDLMSGRIFEDEPVKPPTRHYTGPTMTSMRKTYEGMVENLAGGSWSEVFREAGMDFSEIRAISTYYDGELNQYLARGLTKSGRWFTIDAMPCEMCRWDCGHGRVTVTYHNEKPEPTFKGAQERILRGAEHPEVIAAQEADQALKDAAEVQRAARQERFWAAIK